MLLATVGMDFTTGVDRFTFGFWELSEGIHFIPVMIGLFAGTEFLTQAGSLDKQTVRAALDAVRLPSREDFRTCAATILRSCGIGTFIGLLPAEGGTVAAMIGYNEAKRWARDKSRFGKGDIRGVAGPETANNAATGAAMVPTLALGIPGSATTAIILGALLVHGLRPGPHLFNETPLLLYAIFTAMLLANLIFLGAGLVGAKTVRAHHPDPDADPLARGVRAGLHRRLCARAGDARRLGDAGGDARRLSPQAPRLLGRPDHHGAGARRDGREHPQAVADHLRPQLAALPRAPDRGHLPACSP